MTNQHTAPPMPERFWSKADRSGGPDSCWEWMARRAANGYGQFWKGGRVVKAHRIAWELTSGAVADGRFVLHHCDNPACVNPSHLWVGSNADNCRDREEKARGRNSKQAACIHGHLFDAANTRYDRDGHRACRKCGNRRRNERARRVKAGRR